MENGVDSSVSVRIQFFNSLKLQIRRVCKCGFYRNEDADLVSMCFVNKPYRFPWHHRVCERNFKSVLCPFHHLVL